MVILLVPRMPEEKSDDCSVMFLSRWKLPTYCKKCQHESSDIDKRRENDVIFQYVYFTFRRSGAMLSRCFDQDETISTESGIDTYWHSPLVSLEDATRPLLGVVPRIEDSVKLAKTLCLKSPHGLSHDQSAAIYLYTMETGKQSIYVILNSILRTNNDVIAFPWFLYLKLLGTALSKLPSFSGCAWRAVRGDVAGRYKKHTHVFGGGPSHRARSPLVS